VVTSRSVVPTSKRALHFSTADRMEKLNGAQGFLTAIVGEGLVGSVEVDGGGDLTAQVMGGVGVNISNIGPASWAGGVVINWVDRWDWVRW